MGMEEWLFEEVYGEELPEKGDMLWTCRGMLVMSSR